ncbi:MAG: hypothetical protein AAGJ35_14660, partial [Myxococcota bacterium]
MNKKLKPELYGNFLQDFNNSMLWQAYFKSKEVNQQGNVFTTTRCLQSTLNRGGGIQPVGSIPKPMGKPTPLYTAGGLRDLQAWSGDMGRRLQMAMRKMHLKDRRKVICNLDKWGMRLLRQSGLVPIPNDKENGYSLVHRDRLPDLHLGVLSR